MSACTISTGSRLLAALLAAAVTGCASAGAAPVPSAGAAHVTDAPLLTLADLLPRDRPPIADLPVPVGFKLVESISRAYDWTGGRLVDHTYEGHADKQEVIRFYSRQMPALGWTAAGNQNVRGDARLEFTSARPERCAIQITETAPHAATEAPVRITITVLPVGRAANQP